MADKVEEKSENEDKNDKEAKIEGEKAKKDDENEKIKTAENQAKDDDLEKDAVHENSNQQTEEQKDDKAVTETNDNAKKPAKPKKEAKREDKVKMSQSEVKLANTHYKTHSRTTLPHILTEYGMEDKEHPKKEKKEKRKKKKKAEEKDETDDDDRRRRRAREQHFRQTFGDNREMDSHYAEYIDFLEKKVQEERARAEKQREEEKRQAAMRDEEESEEESQKKPAPPQDQRQQRHKLQRRLQRVELHHDDTFMKELPRTDISRIIVLQDRMKRQGKLKTQGEVDKFWQDIKKPDVFYAQFKVKPADPAPQEELEMNTNENSGLKPGDPKMPPRALSHISESSRGDKESWAITQKFQSSNGPKSPTLQRKGSAQLAREAALDLERRCPKLEMPPMSCFSLQLGEKPPDPEEIQKKVELRMREKSRKKTQRKLNRMYQMAMTNTAAANRILAQHNDLTSMFEGAALRDVLSVFDDPYLMGPRRGLTAPAAPMAPASMAMEAYPGEDRTMEVAPGSSSQSSSRRSSAASRRLTPISDTSTRHSSKSRKSKKPSLEAIEYPAPVPLALAELGREKTMEPKCLSTMWTNYMHAGTSVFAHT